MVAGIFAWLMTTTLGRLVRNVLIVGAAFGVGYVVGEMDASKDAHIASLKSQLEAANTDARIADNQRKLVQKQLAALDEQHSGLARQVSSYETEISKLSDAARSCRAATDNDVRRLRAIR